MKLSIIIPVYRNETTLERCLTSVVGQTFRDWELILVDDGSPDGCPQLCDEWARRDPRIHVVHKENGGLSDARNAGLEVAQGEYVTFVDADDWLDEHTFSRMMPVADSCDLLEYPIFCHYGSPRQQLVQPGDHVYDDAAGYWLQGHAYEHSYACNKVFRRSLFEQVRFPKGRVFEDMATLPLLLEKAGSIRTTSQGCYFYTENAEGITNTAGGRELQMLLESHLQAMRRWQDDRYYMHVLDIQLDVCRLTGRAPLLPTRRLSPFTHGLSPVQRLKSLLLYLLGIKTLCRIHTTVRRR